MDYQRKILDTSPTDALFVTANHLLAAMPRQAYQRMLTGLEPVELNYAQVLYEPMEQIRNVYFPINCLVCLLTAVDERWTLEVRMVGNEGIVGMPMALGIGVSEVLFPSRSSSRWSRSNSRADR